jgi:hypothetical protein
MPIYQIASFRCRATEANVSSGSKADIPLIPSNVRFRTLTSYSITLVSLRPLAEQVRVTPQSDGAV